MQQKTNHEVSVMWFVKGDDNKVDLLEKYETDTIKPWRVKQSKIEKKDIQQDQSSDEYFQPSEIPFGLDALVCNCLIGGTCKVDFLNTKWNLTFMS